MVEPLNRSAERAMPLGDEVAKWFPWWRQGTVTFAIGAYPGAPTRFIFGPNNDPCQNNLDARLRISEIRFANPRVSRDAQPSIMNQAVRIRHTRYDIINQWLPMTTLQTEDSLQYTGDSASSVVHLPTPYYLQRGQTFFMELQSLDAAVASDIITVALRGKDPINGTPIVMSKQVTLPVVNGRVPVAFDDNRDSGIRDMLITDVVFGYERVNTAPTSLDYPHYINVRFKPPTGPLWTENVWTRLSGLCSYWGGVDAAATYRPIVIYRPKTPHILYFEEALKIECLQVSDLGTELTSWCWVIGEQEGTHVR